MSTPSHPSTPPDRELASNAADAPGQAVETAAATPAPSPATTGPHQSPALPALNTTGPHQLD